MDRRVARLVSAARRRLHIDTRALAALRIALGMLVVADLVLRARSLTAFYTDRGVLPREAFLGFADPLHPSLHFATGEAWMQGILFLVAAVLGLALLIGYRTTIATVGSWILLVSLQNRMPMVLNSGDVLLRVLLFWAIFLPLGARWSVDAVQDGQRRDTILSIAGVGLLLQAVLVYLVNAVFKLQGDIWLAGDALGYVFGLGQFTVLLGDLLAPYAWALWPIDYLWLTLLAGSWLLLVLPGRARTVLVGVFAAGHLGMAVTMQLGLFPFISIASLLPFLPSSAWDRLEKRAERMTTNKPLERLAGWLPTISVGGGAPKVNQVRSVVVTIVPLVFIVLVVLWNIQYLGLEQVAGQDVAPDVAEDVLHLTRMDQYWNMFAPDPLSVDGWLVAPGVLANGSRVDAFHGGSVEWDRPPDVSATFPSARWRKYITRLWRYGSPHRDLFASYLCDRWNRRHDVRLRNVTAVYVEQPVRADGTHGSTTRVELAQMDC
ncbi:MAG: HTTM domain-containing protein [Salinirussus sp.]